MKQRGAAWSVYNLIREDDENKLSGTIFDTLIVLFILLNVVFIVLDTFHFGEVYQRVSYVVEIISVVVFTAEYALRLWTAPYIRPDQRPALARLRWAFSFMALVDLISILPFYLPFIFPMGLAALRSLRILRLLRLLKINRYTAGFTMIAYVFKKKARLLLSSIVVIFMLMFIAAVIMYNVESERQPDKFVNAFSALWWALSTVTTIGYGDLYPITPLGQLLGGVIAFLGIGLVAMPTGIISAGFIEAAKLSDEKGIEAVEEAIEEPNELHHSPEEADHSLEGGDEKKYCPYCGHRLDE